MRLYIAIIILFTILSPMYSMAGSFKVYPVKVSLNSAKKTDTLHIQNQGDRKINLQLTAVSWNQDSQGKGIFEPTRSLVFFPQIFEIQSGEERIIRLGYKSAPTKTENAYRLFIEELPEPGKSEGTNSLQMVLKMSVPIFISPVIETLKQGEISSLSLSDDGLAVAIQNTGNSYFFIKGIQPVGETLDGSEVVFPEKKGWYLLSGNKVNYPLEISKAQCRELKQLQISVTSDDLEMERQFPIDAAFCRN